MKNIKNKFPYAVYKFTNLKNEKSYIGFTNNEARRYKTHISCAADKSTCIQAIHKALHKYGVDNFNYEILERFKTLEEASNAEIQYIKQFRSNNFKFGYNQTTGGVGFGYGKNRKLYKKYIRLIFEDYISETLSLSRIAEKYDLSRDSVSKILLRVSYSDIYIPQKLINKALFLKNKKDNSKKVNEEILEKIKLESYLDNR